MIYRPYGNTGMNVSALGFGGMRFDDIDDQDACAALVRAAYEAGVNYFDTAPGYFGGRSEQAFGLAFKGMAATRAEKPFYVSTKSNKADPDDIRRDLEASLERLGLDRVDVFHMWWVVRPQTYYQRKARGALKAFTRLRDEGLVRHISLSSHMSGEECVEVLNDFPFAGVLLGYSAMNFRFRERALEAAAGANRGVVCMNPLGGGLIPRYGDRFSFLKTRPEETVVEAAIRFLLNDPRITVALVGFGNRAHLDEALSAVHGFRPLPAAEVERIRDALGAELDHMCTGCGYCLPCPEGVPVRRMMLAYNSMIFAPEKGRQGITNALKYGFDLLDDPLIDRCTECGQCEERCTQKLPIRERLKEIAAAVEAAAE